jgi:putative FmdB family regulatory protein
MPLYEYLCGTCGLKFEELKSSKEEASTTPCRKCSGMASRQMSSFAAVVAGGSPVETADMTVGREANKRWQQYHDRQSKRRGDKELKSFELPKAKDGKYMPVMALGEKKTVDGRKEYVSALQEHRKDRAKRGIAQFSGAGSF